ncbi:unnamed protein product, partial [Musa acuminata subsp. malaccensis]
MQLQLLKQPMRHLPLQTLLLYRTKARLPPFARMLPPEELRSLLKLLCRPFRSLALRHPHRARARRLLHLRHRSGCRRQDPTGLARRQAGGSPTGHRKHHVGLTGLQHVIRGERCSVGVAGGQGPQVEHVLARVLEHELRHGRRAVELKDGAVGEHDLAVVRLAREQIPHRRENRRYEEEA